MEHATVGRIWEDDELRAWRPTCRRFFEHEAVPHQQRWREQHEVDRELRTKAAEIGLLWCGAPAQYGGGGGTFAQNSW